MNKQQVINLWKIAFGDTDEFIRLWFEHVYKDEQTLTLKKNDQIVSALQILPYDMTYCGSTIPVGYICGVCTLPSERGMGHMTQLMNHALHEMRRCDYALAILIPASPALFDLYRRFGFTNVFDYTIEMISRDHKADCADYGCRIVAFDKLSPALIYAYYRSKQRERHSCILHSAAQFDTICHDRLLGGGEIWVAFENEHPVGLAFTDPVVGDTLSIREIMYNTTALKNHLVQSLLTRHKQDNATLRIPPTPSQSLPYGMATIVNTEPIVSLFQAKNPHFLLPDHTQMDIPTFTQTLLKYERHQPYMNLMLD